MQIFESLDAITRACLDLPAADPVARIAAADRQLQLTKPIGSLGRLEEIAVFIASWQGRAVPSLTNTHVLIFAGSHGVTRHGVSAFPNELNEQMVANFGAGGAAINQLCKQAGAILHVHPIELERPTADLTTAPAMTNDEVLAAINVGVSAVPLEADLICVGEMGIGNTTVAAALAAALFGGSGEEWVGRGTGVDDSGLARKAAVVDAALAFHGSNLRDPLLALQRVGGKELAAMFGALLEARRRSIPVLLDGFVATSAASVLSRLTQDGLSHVVAGHVSAEAQHRRLLGLLRLDPILDLGMRLGEGSGACLALNIIHSAVACHAGMATFSEAGLSGAS